MKESVRIIRFAIVGTLNALIAAFVVWLLMHIEGESYIIANICAYIVAQIHNFIWCKYWIFPLETDDKKNSIWHQMLFFIGAFALAYSAQFLFFLCSWSFFTVMNTWHSSSDSLSTVPSISFAIAA